MGTDDLNNNNPNVMGKDDEKRDENWWWSRKCFSITYLPIIELVFFLWSFADVVQVITNTLMCINLNFFKRIVSF